MLSQNKKTIMITITSFVITGAALGGVVNAEQRVVNAQQNAVNAQQNSINVQEYRFPPTNALAEIKPQPAPVAQQVTRPVTNSQPVRQASRPVPRATQGYPRPYPSQRPMNPNVPPRYGSYAPGSYTPGPGPMPMRSGPGAPPPYAMPTNPYNRSPYNQSPYNRGPYTQGPYGNPYNSNPYNRGPYNAGPYGGGPSNNGPFGDGGSPFKNFGGGPFNGDSAPWETWPFGARDSFWSRKEFPFDEQNPTDWFKPGDPKEGMAIMWDDMIAAPDDLGTMPGGWHVPSVSVPNPIDLEDQLEKASKEIPDLIRVYNE